MNSIAVSNELPDALLSAQKADIQFFMGERCEWKLELTGSMERIEKLARGPVYVFANNGFGDHLFLKNNANAAGFDPGVYEFLHEGPEIKRLSESLETLLELKDRPPSTDVYPKAVYETDEPVQLGDKVQIKVWAEFWKGWQDGVVEYVPGISKKKNQHEYNGLKWVSIRFRHGHLGPLVGPKTGIVRKVRLASRAS